MHSEPDEQLGNLTPELACFSARRSREEGFRAPAGKCPSTRQNAGQGCIGRHRLSHRTVSCQDMAAVGTNWNAGSTIGRRHMAPNSLSASSWPPSASTRSRRLVPGGERTSSCASLRYWIRQGGPKMAADRGWPDVAAVRARNPTLSPCPFILPRSHAHCHKTVTELISFSNVSAIRRASARAVRYGFSMHLTGELAMPLCPKNTG